MLYYSDFEFGQRIAQVIRYSGHNNVQFAERVGWTPQYIQKLLNGECIGLTTVTRILSNYPEIDARWFLFGEGCMFDLSRRLSSMCRFYEFAELVPYMTADDRAAIDAGQPVPPEWLTRWNQARENARVELQVRWQRYQDRMAEKSEEKKG